MAIRGVQQEKAGFLVYDREGKMELTTTLPNFFLGAMNREDPLIRKLGDKISQLCSSVISEINQAIVETKINDSDLEINYLELLPDNCQCEVDVNPDASLKNTSL